jgi:hypothetical protein
MLSRKKDRILQQFSQKSDGFACSSSLASLVDDEKPKTYDGQMSSNGKLLARIT